jgi:SAM-dependent methyltransferase
MSHPGMTMPSPSKISLNASEPAWLVRNFLHRAAHALGKSRYSIVPGYRHRSEPVYFDDTGFADEWQREVYEFAADLMAKDSLRTVYDVGCGSGFKLVKYLGRYETTGFDVEPTVTFLQQKYPDRKWVECSFRDRSLPPADLVVCGDVIEHVGNPDELLDFLKRVASARIVLSTPDRGLLYSKSSPLYYGPPQNPHHLREWNFSEFHRYVARHFRILRHVITNRAQATQMILCAPPSG